MFTSTNTTQLDLDPLILKDQGRGQKIFLEKAIGDK